LCNPITSLIAAIHSSQSDSDSAENL
jgi:hypothetical protein